MGLVRTALLAVLALTHDRAALGKQIQREVDQVETVPVPTPEPLDTEPQ